VRTIEILRGRGYKLKLVVVGPPTTHIENEGVGWRFAIFWREEAKLL